MAKDRAEAIDEAVERAVRGSRGDMNRHRPPPNSRPMSLAERYQIDAENKGFPVSQAKLERLRKQQHAQ